MAINKHATIRYKVLDTCFANHFKKYFIQDLLDACNKSLLEVNPDSNGVSKRQLYNDIKFMESEEGWSAPIKRIYQGKKPYYQYEDPNFSIFKNLLKPQELDQLREAIELMNRFSEVPDMQWIDTVLEQINQNFELNNNPPVVHYDINPYVKGFSHFHPLLQYIINREVIAVEYKSFYKEKCKTYTIHPYQLKQYAERWYLIGLNPDVADNIPFYCLPLDRIISYKPLTNIAYIPCSQERVNDFYEDVVGIDVYPGSEIETVHLWIDNTIFPYFETRPIHGSQRVIEREADRTLVELRVKINYELGAHLFPYLDEITIVKPLSFRDELFKKLERCMKRMTS